MNVNLVLFKKNGSRKTFKLPSTVTTIGRRQECDLCIPLMEISRRHCELNLHENNLMLRDIGSKNGTYLNGRHVQEELKVNPGDEIQVGPIRFGVQINGYPEEFTADQESILQKPQSLDEQQGDIFEYSSDETEEMESIDLTQSYDASGLDTPIDAMDSDSSKEA